MEAITTVIYYASNQEEEPFAQKIRDRLWKSKGGLPLVSVTQKPLDFGDNICVGDIGPSEENVWRQLLIGCHRAKTPYILSAEADTLYPPEYFTYKPESVKDRYWFEGVWILFHNKDEYYSKGRSDCAHMAGREYLIDLLERGLREKRKSVYKGTKHPLRVDLQNPVVSIKTGKGMRSSTQTWPIGELSLPLWGSAYNLRREFFHEL
jgi:hypothetical protein